MLACLLEWLIPHLPSEHTAVWRLSIANSQSQRTLAYYFGRTSCSLASVQGGQTCTPGGSWWGIVTPHGRRTKLRMKMLCSWMLRALENLASMICRSRTIAFGASLLSDTKKNIKGEVRWQYTQKHTHPWYTKLTEVRILTQSKMFFIECQLWVFIFFILFPCALNSSDIWHLDFIGGISGHFSCFWTPDRGAKRFYPALSGCCLST